jgi:hypothetical protein
VSKTTREQKNIRRRRKKSPYAIEFSIGLEEYRFSNTPVKWVTYNSIKLFFSGNYIGKQEECQNADEDYGRVALVRFFQILV